MIPLAIMYHFGVFIFLMIYHGMLVPASFLPPTQASELAQRQWEAKTAPDNLDSGKGISPSSHNNGLPDPRQYFNITQPTNEEIRYDIRGTTTTIFVFTLRGRPLDRESLGRNILEGQQRIRAVLNSKGDRHLSGEDDPFLIEKPGFNLQIDSTDEQGEGTMLTYQMVMDALIGLFKVLYIDKRYQPCDFLISVQGLDVVGTGSVTKTGLIVEGPASASVVRV